MIVIYYILSYFILLYIYYIIITVNYYSHPLILPTVEYTAVSNNSILFILLYLSLSSLY